MCGDTIDFSEILKGRNALEQHTNLATQLGQDSILSKTMLIY